jgi:cytidylate kinase
MPAPVIAIDGPAGSGKSTAARRLAEALNYTYINTGAMYRAVAHLALQGGIDIDDPQKARVVADVARAMRFDYVLKDGQQRFVVNGHDSTDALFTAELTGRLKPVVNNNDVRAALVEKMRAAAQAVLAQGARGVIMEGRDIGTVVFPDAAIKFYVHADLAERACRRVTELRARGEPVDLHGIQKQIEKRDDTDKGREVGALVRAPDAIDVDTTHRNEEQTLEFLLEKMRECGLAT